MELWLNALLATLIVSAILAVTLFLGWLFLVMFYVPTMEETLEARIMIRCTGFIILVTLAQGFVVIPSALWIASLQFLATLRQNLAYIVALSLICAGGYVWLEYHDVIISNYIVARQCALRPAIDFFALPVVNILRFVYNAIIPVVNFWTNLYAFYEFGLPLTLFRCGLNTEITTSLADGAAFLYAVFNDFNVFFQQDYFHAEWNIMDAVFAFGLFIDSLIPLLDCLCLMLNFLWVYFATFFQLHSWAVFLNYVWNLGLSVAQLAFNTVLDLPNYPDFTNVTLNACGAIESGGTVFEDWAFLTLETGWGVLTNTPNLPSGIGQVLSIPYTQILTHPLCGAVKVVNMTAVLTLHFPQIFASDGSGVQFFQFGFVFDEFRVAALAAGMIFGVFNNQAQVTGTQLGLTLVDLVAFPFEWIIGNVFYEGYGGALPASWGRYNITPPQQTNAQFIRYYFVDYWLKAPPLSVPVTLNGYTYSSALSQFFTDVFLLDESFADLIGLINDPFGEVVRFTFNALWALVMSATNFVSFVYCELTYQCDGLPITYRNVNYDVFFNQLYFLAGALGDMVKQFDANSCQVTPQEGQKDLICCTGNMITTLLDAVVLGVQTITHFVQDIETLPTFQVHLCLFGLYNATNKSQCVRLVNFQQALQELNVAIDDFACAVTSLIPTLGNFQCQFPPPPTQTPGLPPQPPKQCAKVQSCMGNLLASIIQLLTTVPLQIGNALFVKTLNGQFFVGSAEFIQFSALLVLGQLAAILANFGLMLDCILCALQTGQHTNCPSPIYQIFYEFGQLLISVAQIFTSILLQFASLLLNLTVGLFGQGKNPIQSLIDFVVGVFNDVFGGIGTTVIKVIVGLFDSLGLSIVGQFINIIWSGFCWALQGILTVFVWVLNLVTFDALNLPQVNFCCGGGNCTLNSNGKRADGQNIQILVNGTAYLSVDTWLNDFAPYYWWPASDPCNASVQVYQAQNNWSAMSSNEQGEVLYCLFKGVWQNRTDGQYSIGNSTCDELVLYYAQTPWTEIAKEGQCQIIDCVKFRVLTDAIRLGLNQTWIPQDILTNPFRIGYFGMEMMRGYLIEWQYQSDQQKPVPTILSPQYQQYWASFGLNTSQYARLQNASDVAEMRATYRMEQYFEANNAKQYAAVLATSTGFWRFVSSMLSALENATVALSANETNPMVYLNNNYSLNNPVGAATGAFMNIMQQSLQLVTTFSSYWSDPVNYKKRSVAWTAAKEGLYNAYTASKHQWSLMAQEYVQSSVYVGQMRAGKCGMGAQDEVCDAAEQQRLAREFDLSIRGLDEYKGQTSVIYKLSTWWERNRDTFLQTYPILNPRYGTNRSTYGPNATRQLSYRLENGTTVNETHAGRFWRYLSLVNRGTPAAQKRWQTMYAIWDRVRSAVYHQVLKRMHNPQAVEKVRLSDRRVLIRPRDANDQTHEILCDHANHCTVQLSAREREFMQNMPTASAPGQAQQQQQQRHRGSEWVPASSRRTFDALMRASNIHGLAEEERSEALVAMMFHVADFFSITCYTNITLNCTPPLVCNGSTTTLCEQCLYLDQLIGRVTAATDQLIGYYLGGPFQQSINETFWFFEYCFNPNAYVIVGNSSANNVQDFPAMGGDILNGVFADDKYVNDPGPKVRFNDIAEAIDAALNSTNSSLANITISPEGSLIDTVVLWFISTVFWYGENMFRRFFVFFGSGDVTIQGESALLFTINWFIFCDWLIGDDYSCKNKRFSIGEMVVGYTVVAVSIEFFTMLVFGINCFSIVTGTSLSLIIILDTFLSLYANWAALCAPGLPVCLMNDITYFLGFTAFPKCSFVWGFLIKQNYTNTNCYACANTANWTYYNCRKDLPFRTFVDNLIFVTQEYFPSVLDWIRETRTPLYSLYAIPYINERLNEFANLGINTYQRTFSLYYGCNWIMTFVPNFNNLQLFLIIFYMIVSPPIGAAIAIGYWAFQVLLWVAVFLFYILMYLVLVVGSTPYDRIQPLILDPVPRSAPLPSNALRNPSGSPTATGNKKQKKEEEEDVTTTSQLPQWKTKQVNLSVGRIANRMKRAYDTWRGLKQD